jgi:hypothetical protein
MSYEYDSRYHAILQSMKHLDGHPRFYELLATMACVHADKNHDYAGVDDPLVNFRACETYGIDAIEGIVTRITDKDMRFRNWFRKRGTEELRVNESVVDTLQDRAVYTLLLIILLEEASKTGTTD